MASCMSCPFTGNVVSVVEAHRESRIARLLGEFEACRLKLRKLRDMPEMTALLDTFFPFTGNVPQVSDDITIRTTKSERAVHYSQSRKTNTEYSRKATDVPRRAENVPELCNTATVEAPSNSINNDSSPTVLGTCSYQMITQGGNRENQTRVPTMKELSPSDHGDVSKIRIVRVESLSGCGTNKDYVNGTVQSPITPPNLLVYRTAPLPPHLSTPSEMGAQFHSRPRTSSIQYPFNNVSGPPSRSLNQTTATYESPRPVPPLLRYSAPPLQQQWLGNTATQRTQSSNVIVPKPLRHTAFPFVSQTTTDNGQWSANGYASAPPQQPGSITQRPYACAPTRTYARSWGMDMYRIPSSDLSPNWVSYGAYRASNENKLYTARQTSSLAKRPRYETFLVS